MIKKIVECLIDTIVVSFLCMLAITLIICSLLFSPFMGIKLFFAKQAKILAETADDFLGKRIDD